MRELLGARLIANLATISVDGTVHVVALWFLWRPPYLLLPTSHSTRKIRNLERDPRTTIMIDDSQGGFDLRGVTLLGEAVVDRGADAVAMNREIHLKYLTEDGRRLAAVDAYLTTDDVTIRFLPRRHTTWNLRDTSQGKALKDHGGWRPLD